MALVGPSGQQPIPETPGTDEATTKALTVIRSYVQKIAINLVQRTVGLTGVIGLSGTGTPAVNFRVLNRDISNAIRVTIGFSGIEADASYGVWMQSTAPASTLILSYSAVSTGLAVSFAQTTLAGTAMNVLLLR